MDTGARAARNELFQALKPRCVELSQLALRDDGSANSAKALVQSINQLLTVLKDKCQQGDGTFDEKLADYVFFPLSQILKKRQKYTDRLAELTLSCLRILLEHGWSRAIALDLAKQLLILLSFAAGGLPDQKGNAIPEEISCEAYGSLAALFRDIGVTPGGPAALIDTGTIPALGHCVTVILDGIKDGAAIQVQVEALKALDAVWHCVKDAEALASFLPGTISALTKYLMPGTADRRSRKSLISALVVLEHVLRSLLSDVRTRNIRKEDQKPKSLFDNSAEQKVLSKSWLKATTAQIKLALSNIVRLRKHSALDVRQALNKLCLVILDECHETMSESASLLVETCMILDGVDDEQDLSKRGTSITDLATIHTDIGELVKSTAYNWVTSLPRVMQANDESAKQSALDQLRKANHLLKSLNSDSSILEEALGNALRDSITVTVESVMPKPLQEAEFDMNSQAAMTLSVDNAVTNQFRPVILAEGSQKQTREKLTELLTSLGTRESQINMAGGMLEYIRGASGPSLLAAYWLSFQILKSSAANNEDIDEFFDSSLTLSDEQENMGQELISFSQSVLSNDDDDDISTSDWRMQAIALEVVAHRAQSLREGFRPELIDTLYPIAQLLGSPNSDLREHAITCLNVVSKACGYANASSMIIDNVDYMVNSISLRLNTFDISPQAPQVLVMMIRLAGPSLLLYLDDVVASIFAALDNFHGYQKLVEVLFSVLDEIVKVGSISPQMQIEAKSDITLEKHKIPPPTIDEVLRLISKSSKSSSALLHEDFPRAPWKSARTLLDEADAARQVTDSEEQEEQPSPPQTELTAAPPNKTYTLLQSITRLSQHYLTSPSPLLRTKLLTLITTASSSLSNNTDNYLPLINDIWPVILPLIHDPSPYHWSTLRNLLGDIIVEDGLDQDKKSTVLVLDTKLLGFQEDGNIVNLADRALLLGFSDDPTAKLIVLGVAATFSIFVIILPKNELLLEVIWELLGTSFDSLCRHVNSPFIVLDFGVIKLFSTGLDLASKLIITARLNSKVTVSIGSIFRVIVSAALAILLVL
ncbi:putative TEL2-interacting protein 1 [Halenospora varia]|nr:putative TEL2-interacting protein 1 [Halenospora varia]